MCVIVVKPNGAALPSEEVIDKCWSDNPHGAGFSITRAGSTRTIVEKGFMDLKSFKKYLNKYNPQVDDLVVLHFRWATHGHLCPEHTHPFPVSSSRVELERLQYITDSVVFHNGVIHINGQPNNCSDTMYYIENVIARMNPIDFQVILSQAIGSRFFIIEKGIPVLLGDGWEQEQGIYYSNMSWKKASVYQEMSDEEWEALVQKVTKKSKP